MDLIQNLETQEMNKIYDCVQLPPSPKKEMIQEYVNINVNEKDKLSDSFAMINKEM